MDGRVIRFKFFHEFGGGFDEQHHRPAGLVDVNEALLLFSVDNVMGVGEGEARLGEIAASIEFDLITVFPKVIADGLFGEGVLSFRGFGEGEAFLKGENTEEDG